MSLEVIMSGVKERVKRLTGSAVASRVGVTLPALAGIAFLAVGVGGIVQAFAGTGGLFTGLACAGILCLRIDSRL
jgi:hypothetical protein